MHPLTLRRISPIERRMLQTKLRTRPRPRPHAQRLPAGYPIRHPGDLVQVDTLDVLVVANVRRKQFTARDMISRYDVVEVYGRATAQTATAFLAALVQRMPFPIRALQIDGGSEFRGVFEAACAARDLQLFVVPPRSPKLQSHVERAQRTHREEFYEVWPVHPTLAEPRVQLQAWAHIYNTIRPHPASALPHAVGSLPRVHYAKGVGIRHLLNEYNDLTAKVPPS